MSGKTASAQPVIAKSDSFKVGQHVSTTEVIDDKMVRGYADVTGDHNLIHMDEAFAEKTKFHHRIAHGGILFGLASKVLGEQMPGLGTIYMSLCRHHHRAAAQACRENLDGGDQPERRYCHGRCLHRQTAGLADAPGRSPGQGRLKEDWFQ